MSHNIPFHCGAQYVDWLSRNCDRCALGRAPDGTYRCPIQQAIRDCACGEPMTDEMFARMGAKGNECALTWDCPERQTA